MFNISTPSPTFRATSKFITYYLLYIMLPIIFFLTIPPLWGYPSLFFTKQEVHLMNQKFLSQNKNTEWLYLSALIYVDADHWTLWLNHQVIHASDPQMFHGFHIEKVTPFAAEFSWLPPQSILPIRFSLRSHQIFLGKERKIIQNLKN